MDQTDIIHSGALYYPSDESIMSRQLRCVEKLYDYNATRPLEQEKRTALLKEMFAEIGDGCYIEPPLHSNWGGRNVHFGKGVYANFNLTLVDDTHIYVGDHTMLGPNVTLATAGHPIYPPLRQQGYQYNVPIHIGKNCWLGAGVVVLPTGTTNLYKFGCCDDLHLTKKTPLPMTGRAFSFIVIIGGSFCLEIPRIFSVASLCGKQYLIRISAVGGLGMKKLLIADASPAITDALVYTFAQEYDVHICSSQSEVPAIIDALRPDALIINASFVCIDGLYRISRIRFTPSVIIILTNIITDQLLHAAQDINTQYITMIPFSIRALRAQLRELLVE